MTLQETQEIITRWINSCETSEQLELILEVIDKFIFERFAGLVTVFDMDLARSELNSEWLDRKLIVAHNQTAPDTSNETPR